MIVLESITNIDAVYDPTQFPIFYSALRLKQLTKPHTYQIYPISTIIPRISKTPKYKPSRMININQPSLFSVQQSFLYRNTQMKQQPITKQLHDEQERKKAQLQRKKAESQALSTLTLGQNPTQEFISILMKQFRQMSGPTEQKVKRLFNRLQKFFLRDKGARINIKDGYFCKKREPFYQVKGVHVVDNQIMLFGVDFAKHSDIIKSYQPDDFYPVDMSHVKLIYADFFAAMDVLRRNQRQGVEQNVIKLEKGLQEPSKGWMEMKPYYISNYERRVLARFATSEQLEIVNTRKLECNIPLFAKKVYDLKKKESADVLENCRLREQRLQIKKQQKREKRNHEDNIENYDRDNNNFNDRISQKSYTLNIGKGRDKLQDDKSSVSYSYRERSRQKDFDKVSVCSKSSSLSQLAGLANKMNLQDKEQKQSIVSDASFILDQNNEIDEVFRDMAMRLAGTHLDQRRQEDSQVSYELPRNEQSFVSQASSQSYRLSENMPDRREPVQQENSRNRSFNYSQYMEEQERIEQQKRKEEMEIVIVLDDD